MRKFWHQAGQMRIFFLIPIGVFILTSIVGYFCIVQTLRHSYSDIRTTFEKEGEGVQDFATEKVSEYLQAIYDSKVLFSISGNASRADFSKQNNSTVVKQTYPGLSMVGYAPKTSLDGATNLIVSVRADKTVNTAGYPDYKIFPTKNSGYYLPIVYLEPYVKEMAGLDLMSVETVRDSVEKSIATGKPSMTGKIRLYGDRDGFLMVDAVYTPGADISTEQARGAAFSGVVFTGYKSYDLFPILLEKAGMDPQIGVEIFAGNTTTSEALLFSTVESCNTSCESDFKNPLTILNLPLSASGSGTISVLDAEWTVSLDASDSYIGTHLGVWPTLVFFGSIIMIIGLTTLATVLTIRKWGITASQENE